MKKFIQNKLKDQKGLTLIELLAVIVIIAIIAAIAIPAIGNIIENSRVGAIKSDAQNILSAGELYFVDYPAESSVSLATLVTEGYVEDTGAFPTPGAGVAAVTVTKGTKAGGTTAAPTAATPTTISGAANTGKVQVTFSSASRKNIEAVKNSSKTGGTNVAINRSYSAS